MQRLDRQLGAVLVEEPQPNAHTNDQQNDQRAGALTHGKRGQRRGHEQDQQRIAQLTHQNRKRPRPMAAQRIGPDLCQPRLCLVARETVDRARQAPQHIVGRERGGRRQRQGLPVRPHRRHTSLNKRGHRPIPAHIGSDTSAPSGQGHLTWSRACSRQVLGCSRSLIAIAARLPLKAASFIGRYPPGAPRFVRRPSKLRRLDVESRAGCYQRRVRTCHGYGFPATRIGVGADVRSPGA
jgi:hypothetical protein